jgi:hypothetical protein
MAEPDPGNVVSAFRPWARGFNYPTAFSASHIADPITPKAFIQSLTTVDPRLANVASLLTEWMNGLMFYLKERVDVTKGDAVIPGLPGLVLGSPVRFSPSSTSASKSPAAHCRPSGYARTLSPMFPQCRPTQWPATTISPVHTWTPDAMAR